MTRQIDIFKLNRISDACPAQWEGFNREGHEVYVRFRGDRFAAMVSINPGILKWNDNEELVVLIPNLTGNQWAGWISTYEMRKHLIRHDATYMLSFIDKLRIEFDRVKEYINNKLDAIKYRSIY